MAEGKVRIETLANGMRLVHTSSDDPVIKIEKTDCGYLAQLPSTSNMERSIRSLSEGKMALVVLETFKGSVLPHLANYRKQGEYWVCENGTTFDEDDPERGLRAVTPFRLDPGSLESYVMDLLLRENAP